MTNEYRPVGSGLNLHVKIFNPEQVSENIVLATSVSDLFRDLIRQNFQSNYPSSEGMSYVVSISRPNKKIAGFKRRELAPFIQIQPIDEFDLNEGKLYAIIDHIGSNTIYIKIKPKVARPKAPKELEDDKLKKEFGREDDKPRWAEENRPTKTLSIRVSPSLLEGIDSAVTESGVSDRMEWMRQVILRQLSSEETTPPEFADFRSTGKINVRLEPELIEEIDAVRGNVPRAEWLKRAFYWATRRGLTPSADLII